MVIRFVNAPAREAQQIAARLQHRDDGDIRLTVFSLQKCIKVRADKRIQMTTEPEAR